jgi:hypothetical protein
LTVSADAETVGVIGALAAAGIIGGSEDDAGGAAQGSSFSDVPVPS